METRKSEKFTGTILELCCDLWRLLGFELYGGVIERVGCFLLLACFWSHCVLRESGGGLGEVAEELIAGADVMRNCC